MTHTTDLTSGLPSLPEGYFWRVTRGKYEYHFIAICKNVKHIFWWDTVKEVVSHPIPKHELSASKIVETANYVMNYRNPLPMEGVSHLFGDYLPKTMKKNGTVE